MRVELFQLGDLAAVRLAQLQLQHQGRGRPSFRQKMTSHAEVAVLHGGVQRRSHQPGNGDVLRAIFAATAAMLAELRLQQRMLVGHELVLEFVLYTRHREIPLERLDSC